MIPSQETIDTLAERIQQAYLLRHPGFTSGRMAQGVWEVAAAGLLLVHRLSPSVPVDPEMFVAVQPIRTWSDPWSELTQEDAHKRYVRHVRRVIAQLRTEIRTEIRHVDRLVRRGLTLVSALDASGGKISPLGRYVVACRAEDDSLAERLRPGAERQHRSCPLYQQACRNLLPSEQYPIPRPTGLMPGLVLPAGLELPCFSMN